jgi:hypothetical protein
VDGFDLVVLGPVVARRLAGRVRNQGAVLLTAGSWPGTELEVLVSGRRWRGATADGYGHLQCHDIVATSRGRVRQRGRCRPRCSCRARWRGRGRRATDRASTIRVRRVSEAPRLPVL